MGADLVGNKFSLFPSKISFDIKRQSVVTARNLQNIETFFDARTKSVYNTIHIARVVALFPQASLLRPEATAADSETFCVGASPSNHPKLCRSAAPRAWQLILQSKPSNCFLE